jgi:hypothetical protein
MARHVKIGNILRGVGRNPGRDSVTGDSKNSVGNMPDAGAYPGQAKTSFSGPMSKFGRNAGGTGDGTHYTRAMNSRADGAPDAIGGLPGKGNMAGGGWPKSLKFQNAAGGTDYPSGAAPKGPAPVALGATEKRGGAPKALNRGGMVAGHGPTFTGAGKDTGLVGTNLSQTLPGKGWPKSLRKDIAGHGTLAG